MPASSKIWIKEQIRVKKQRFHPVTRKFYKRTYTQDFEYFKINDASPTETIDPESVPENNNGVAPDIEIIPDTPEQSRCKECSDIAILPDHDPIWCDKCCPHCKKCDETAMVPIDKPLWCIDCMSLCIACKKIAVWPESNPTWCQACFNRCYNRWGYTASTSKTT